MTGIPLALGALVLGGCGGTTTTATVASGPAPSVPAGSEVQSPQPLVLDESSWKFYQAEYSDYGYTYWAARGHNPNADRACTFPTFRVTAYAADGTVLGTSDQMCLIAYPGQTLAYAGQIDSAGQQPANVTIEMAPTKDRDWSLSTEAAPAYTVDGLSEVTGPLGTQTFTGTVSNPGAETEMLSVTVLMRDEAGTLQDGCSGFVDNVPAGGSAPFSLSMYAPAQPHAAIEAYVQPW